MDKPQVGLSADGARLHLSYGPIDLILSADGAASARTAAFAAATRRFDGLLDELVTELAMLRTPFDREPGADKPEPVGPVARRMIDAVWPLRHHEPVSPMAAVAGAVADEIGASLAESDSGDGLERWMVNNGGDIALGLSPGASFRVGLVADPKRFDAADGLDSAVIVRADMGVGGVATSGRHGRSFSLGIADSVTVLASTAATADATATLVANRVDLAGHPAVSRTPANELEPDTDLGDRHVTVGVGALTSREVAAALTGGLEFAQSLVARGDIVGAHLVLAGQAMSVGPTESDDFLIHR